MLYSSKAPPVHRYPDALDLSINLGLLGAQSLLDLPVKVEVLNLVQQYLYRYGKCSSSTVRPILVLLHVLQSST